jgi:hypothetical protein
MGDSPHAPRQEELQPVGDDGISSTTEKPKIHWNCLKGKEPPNTHRVDQSQQHVILGEPPKEEIAI